MIASEADAELETRFRLGTVLGDPPRRDTLCAEPRTAEIASCDPLGGKREAESGRLDSAVDVAALPLRGPSHQVTAYVGAKRKAAMTAGLPLQRPPDVRPTAGSSSARAAATLAASRALALMVDTCEAARSDCHDCDRARTTAEVSAEGSRSSDPRSPSYARRLVTSRIRGPSISIRIDGRRGCFCPIAAAVASCSKAEIVTAPHQSGHAVGADLVAAFSAEQRPPGTVLGGRRSRDAGTHGAAPFEPLVPCKVAARAV
jgi:hypothetical protein